MLKKDRIRRKTRIRSKISGTAKRPRITVFKSNVHIYAQAIDDISAKTLASSDDVSAKGRKVEKAKLVGLDLGKKLIALKINEVVFDRSGYLYHGRVSALVEGLRESGIKV